MNRIGLLVILLGLISAAIAVEGDGGYAGAYLRMGVGARAAGMGNAFTSVADDATAIYWNPAAIGLMDKMHAGIMYGSLCYDQHFGFLGGTMPLQMGKSGYGSKGDGTGSVSAGIVYLGIGNIDGRDVNGLSTGTFSDNEIAIMASYGKSFMNQMISGGATVKYLHHSLSENSANGFGFDLGVFSAPIPNLRLGLVAQDILSSLTWDTESSHKDEFPLTIRGGASYSVPLQFGGGGRGRSQDSAQKVTVAFDLNHNLKEDSFHPHAGVEGYFLSFLGARVGYDDGEFTAGISLSNPKPAKSSGRGIQYSFGLDYAFSTSEIGFRHIISVATSF